MNSGPSAPHTSEEPAEQQTATAEFLNRPEFDSSIAVKQKRRDLLIGIPLLALALVAGAGFWGYHFYLGRHTTRTPAPTSAYTSSQTAAVPQQYLTIKEWGIKLPLSADIKDAYYVDAGSSDDVDGLPSTFSLGLASLNTACGALVPRSWNVMEHSVAELVRTLPTDTDPVSGKLYSQLEPIGATIGGYYIGLADAGLKGGRACISSEKAQALDTALIAAVKNMSPAGVAWKAYQPSTGEVRFLYPADWVASRGKGQFAVGDATSQAFTAASVVTASNPGAPINLYLQVSTDSSTIDCIGAPCQVSGVVPLNNPLIPNAVLAVVNQTSNNGTKFTEYVVADGNTKVGDTSVHPVTFQAGTNDSYNLYVFGQPYYLPQGQGLSNAARVTDVAGFEADGHFNDLITLLNSVE